MTLTDAPGQSNPILSEPDRTALLASAIDPERAQVEWGVHSHGCDLRFPGLGGSSEGIVRYCRSCRESGRGKYEGPRGHTPQPTVVHDAGPGSLVVYVEGVLKALCAGQAAHDADLPLTVVFINGADGISPGNLKTVGAQCRDRDVAVVYDADRETNPHVRDSSVRVEGHLRRAGARTVRFPPVPRVADDATTGLDDHLAQFPAAHRPAELERLLAAAPPDMLDPAVFSARAGALRGEARKSFSRSLAAHVCALGMEEAWVLEWRGRLKAEGGLPAGEFDAVRKDAGERARQQRKQRAEEEVTRKGPEMPSPNEPMEVAAELLKRRPDWQTHLRIWRGDWYGWTGTHWAAAPLTRLTDRLRRDLRDAWYMSGGKEPSPTPWAPTSGKIAEVVDALASYLRMPDEQEPEQGLFAQNGRVGLDGSVSAPDPSVFNIAALPYAYDPQALCPHWDEFLRQSLPDAQDRALLQESVGYLLSGDTTHQKVFFLSGPPGAGKGTVLRAIRDLVGRDACATTSVTKIGTHFGGASLIGKTVAFMPDARFSFSPGSESLEMILQISGEDSVAVPRKNRDDWDGQLPARLVMASNDLPVMSDVSGALYRRLVVIRFGESFQGREDPHLGEKFRGELAGILNWALEGYRRLTERGRFQLTASGYELAMEARRESSPVAAFADDRLVVDPDAWVPVGELFAAWTEYRTDQHFTYKEMSKPGLTRALSAALPGVSGRSSQKKVLGQNTRVLHGLRLKTRAELEA